MTAQISREICKPFSEQRAGADVISVDHKGKLSKFISSKDSQLIPSDLALALWSLIMLENGQMQTATQRTVPSLV